MQEIANFYRNLNLHFDRNALIDSKNKTVAVSDLHIGLEEQFKRRGVLFPLHEKTVLINRIVYLLDKYNPKKFIMVGDILHHFNKIPYKTYDVMYEILKLIYENYKNTKLILIRGNHDIMIDYVLAECVNRFNDEINEKNAELRKKYDIELKKREITEKSEINENKEELIYVEFPKVDDSDLYEIYEYYKINNLLYYHGHKILNQENVHFKSEIDLMIMGHEHPVLELNNHRFSSYLHIADYYTFFNDKNYNMKNILILPSFSNIPSGVKINELFGNFLSPYLKDIKSESFKEKIYPIIKEKEIMYFPNLKEIEDYLQ
ncbi:metallophosphoesterase [Methanococcus voltae]|uniref:Metallophosphoesterase n=1 Tax=Methanococcus voltae (strain ATCC BAA-1334 / A3) TaxID=456320 RepID=D7DT64_METV3|nr:metallophosphoesterase [Methanococcus voltae]MCS3901820.1 metallophosphoesterase superfamily enzyme [Methanococcus voltae]